MMLKIPENPLSNAKIFWVILNYFVSTQPLFSLISKWFLLVPFNFRIEIILEFYFVAVVYLPQSCSDWFNTLWIRDNFLIVKSCVFWKYFLQCELQKFNMPSGFWYGQLFGQNKKKLEVSIFLLWRVQFLILFCHVKKIKNPFIKVSKWFRWGCYSFKPRKNQCGG